MEGADRSGGGVGLQPDFVNRPPEGPSRLHAHETAADRASNGIRTIHRSKLSADRRDMKLDRLITDAETGRDCLVRKTFDELPEHLDFTRCERLCWQTASIGLGREEKGVGVKPRGSGRADGGEFSHDLEGSG